MSRSSCVLSESEQADRFYWLSRNTSALRCDTHRGCYRHNLLLTFHIAPLS